MKCCDVLLQYLNLAVPLHFLHTITACAVQAIPPVPLLHQLNLQLGV